MWYLIVLAFISFVAVVYSKARVQKSYQKNLVVLLNRKRIVNKKDYILSFVIMLAMFILAAFRSINVGNDTKTYCEVYYSYIQQGCFNENFYMEKGFQFFCFIVSKINRNPNGIIIYSTLFIYLLTFFFFAKYTANPLVMVALFFVVSFGSSMNVIRQEMAVSILLYAYVCLKKNKNLLAIIIIMLASLVHSTSLIFLVFVFLKKLKVKRLFLVIVTLVILIVALNGKVVSYVFTKIIPKYAIYMNSDRMGTGWLGVCFDLLRLAFIYLVWIFGTRKTERKELTKWLFIVAVWLTIFGFTMNLFTRIGGFIVSILYVPLGNEILLSSSKNKYPALIFLILVLIGFMIIQLILRPEWNYIYPFTFY